MQGWQQLLGAQRAADWPRTVGQLVCFLPFLALTSSCTHHPLLNQPPKHTLRLTKPGGRVLLLSQNYSPSQVFELCSDPRMGPLVAEACSTGTQHNSSGSSASGSTAAAAAGTSSAGGGGRAALSVHDTSQQAAMRQGLAVFTPQLQQPQEGQEGG